MSKFLPLKLSKKKNTIIAFTLGAAHLLFGASKLMGQTDLIKEFTDLWHFPLWFMYFVGVAQILGGIALFTLRLRMPASLALAFIMIGAIVTTIISGQWINVIICFIVMLLCLNTFISRLKDLALELAIKQGYSKNL